MKKKAKTESAEKVVYSEKELKAILKKSPKAVVIHIKDTTKTWTADYLFQRSN